MIERIVDGIKRLVDGINRSPTSIDGVPIIPLTPPLGDKIEDALLIGTTAVQIGNIIVQFEDP